MTEIYSHFDPNEFSEVRKAQENLLCPAVSESKVTNKTKKVTKQKSLGIVKQESHKSRGKIIPMPEQKTGRIRKQA
jgi:hypothetical protein